MSGKPGVSMFSQCMHLWLGLYQRVERVCKAPPAGQLLGEHDVGELGLAVRAPSVCTCACGSAGRLGKTPPPSHPGARCPIDDTATTRTSCPCRSGRPL